MASMNDDKNTGKGAAEEPAPEPDGASSAGAASYDPTIYQRPHPDERGGKTKKGGATKPRDKGAAAPTDKDKDSKSKDNERLLLLLLQQRRSLLVLTIQVMTQTRRTVLTWSRRPMPALSLCVAGAGEEGVPPTRRAEARVRAVMAIFTWHAMKRMVRRTKILWI